MNALQEMLLYADEEYVKILPCLPERFKTGRVSTLHFPAGTVSFEWDRDAGRLHGEICLNRDSELTLGFSEDFCAVELISEDCDLCRGEAAKWHLRADEGCRILFRGI